jgi:hypothetical protein
MARLAKQAGRRAAAAAALAAAGLIAAPPVAAQTEIVSAAQPESLAQALKGAGHQVTLGTDDLGDPVLDLVMQGYKARLLFLDCDPATHDKCGSIQFLSSFDAPGAGLSTEDANAFARRYRYAAVSVSANGDPRLRWDIETGSGIPREVFVTSAARFLSTVQAMGAMLFPPSAGAP